MSVLHLNQIAKRITETFEPYVPKEDLGSSDPEVRQKILSRCLAAFGIQSLVNCTPQEAGNAVVDGGDDNGIDAVIYQPIHNSLVVLQAKWLQNGIGEPDSGEIGKFCQGVRDLINQEFDRFNDRIKARQANIEAALSSFNCRIILGVIYTGTTGLAEHGRRRLDDLLGELNDAAPLAEMDILRQTEIYERLAQGIAGGSIDLEFAISNWGKIDSPHPAFYGAASGKEVATWWRSFGERLFDKNLRGVLGLTDVNKQIHDTIEGRPEDFWFFNNGITVIAASVEKTLAGGGNRDMGVFKARDAYVVNGAQTVSTLGRFSGDKTQLDKVWVPLRVVSLENSDTGYGELITKANNTQNRIEPRDFVAQDPEQLRIKSELLLEGINYELVRSERQIEGENSFGLEEATVALACATADPSLAVMAKREIGRFWIDTSKSPYKTIFNGSTNGLAVFHAVQINRMIESKLKSLIQQLPRRSGKKYGVLVHGNRLISSVTFALNRNEIHIGTHDFDPSVLINSINMTVENASNQLQLALAELFSDSFPAVVFKNPTKCKTLFDKCVLGQSRPGPS